MVLILLYIIPASPAYPMKKLQDLSFSMINLSEISLITEQGILVGVSAVHLSRASMLVAFGSKTVL